MATYDAWSDALELELAQPFPPEDVLEKTMGGRKISFVPWHRYVARLNRLVGSGWSIGTPMVLHIGDKIIMGIPLTILGTTRTNFGDEDDDEYEEIVNPETGEVAEKKTMYGSPVTNAFAQAFKRSCALFGMGLTMYDKRRARTPPPQRQAPKQWTPQDTAIEAARTRCETKLNTARGNLAVKPEEAERVMGAMASGDLRRIESAIQWLDERLTPARMGADYNQ